MESKASYRELIVWKKAMQFAVLVYKHAAKLPRIERFGLCSQLTRSASSVAANIAEGNGRGTSRDYANFLAIARGSLLETETFLLLAVDLNFLEEASIADTMAFSREIDRMLC